MVYIIFTFAMVKKAPVLLYSRECIRFLLHSILFIHSGPMSRPCRCPPRVAVRGSRCLWPVPQCSRRCTCAQSSAGQRCGITCRRSASTTRRSRRPTRAKCASRSTSTCSRWSRWCALSYSPVLFSFLLFSSLLSPLLSWQNFTVLPVRHLCDGQCKQSSLVCR